MRKPTICMGENKDADQLRGNRQADQRLSFRYTDSTFPPLLIPKFSRFWVSSVTVQAGLCWTWSETQIVGFVMHRLICYKLLHMLLVYKGLHKTQKDSILDKRVTHLLNAKTICHIKSMRAQIRFDQWLRKLFKSLYFIVLSMSRFQS